MAKDDQRLEKFGTVKEEMMSVISEAHLKIKKILSDARMSNAKLFRSEPQEYQKILDSNELSIISLLNQEEQILLSK